MKATLLLVCAFLISSLAIGQSTWYQIPTGTAKKLNAISFSSNNVGYIVGNDSLILKTSNGGQTWQELGINGIQLSSTGDENFSDVHFVDENNGFIVCGFSGTYQTSDGGQTWTAVLGQTSNMWLRSAVYPFSMTDFYIGGSGFFEGAMMDHFSNNTWTYGSLSAFLLQDQYVKEFSFANSNLGLAASNGPYMLRTIDAGVTWDTIPTGVDDYLTSVVMVNDTLCYAGYADLSSQGVGILKSTDGGLTWLEQINSATFFYPSYLSVHAAQNGDVYSGAATTNFIEGLIFESVDGVNWNYEIVDHPINDMTSYSSDITFGVGDSGYLVVNTPVADLGITLSEQIDFEVFPNPVQNILTFENPYSESMEVKLLDVNGRLIQSEVVSPGVSSISCTHLVSGMYFIHAEFGGSVAIKRIVKK